MTMSGLASSFMSAMTIVPTDADNFAANFYRSSFVFYGFAALNSSCFGVAENSTWFFYLTYSAYLFSDSFSF